MVGVVVDLVPPLVDDDMVVEPTKEDQVFKIGFSTVGPRSEMVGL